ncbi:MAG: hypothetical protein ABIP51_23715 [Bacteroidia bacterium]
MLKIKNLSFTPQIIICYALLFSILLCVTGAIPISNYDTQKAKFEKENEPTGLMVKARSYQIEILTSSEKGERVAIYDNERLVDVITLSHNCSLEKVILTDNE